MGEYTELERERIQKLLEEKEQLTNTQRIRNVLKDDNCLSDMTKEGNGDEEVEAAVSDKSLSIINDPDGDNKSRSSLESIGPVITVEDEKQQEEEQKKLQNESDEKNVQKTPSKINLFF